ncbi:MAG: carbamate kinase [Actinomycetota bacterium]|nr:carbamate kinase [Actinomycetota bacterium]
MAGKILIALGGNALLRAKEKGTAEEQLAHVRETCRHLISIIEGGDSIAITHGNGPQVGNILLQNEIASDQLPPMPLDVCVTESQGMIGYMIQRSMDNHLRQAGIEIPVVAIFTQTLVDKDDPAFGDPSKPIGPYYTQGRASELESERGWSMLKVGDRGYRRVVPSPDPLEIIESRAIKQVTDDGIIVIAAGGGGVPVVRHEDGTLHGVEAVIDKDHAAAILARVIGADTLLILTDVEQVYLNYGKPDQQPLDRVSVSEAGQYLEQGQFGKGSMQPKVEAVMDFVRAGGKRAIITSLEKANYSLGGKAGTLFVM